MSRAFNPYANIFYMTNTYFPWKGRTFTQISSAIQQNQNNAKTLTPRQLRMPQPLKIYRRELGIYGGINPGIKTNPVFISNRRISNKIDYLNMPGSTVVSSKIANPVGICDTVDLKIPNNTTELPGMCKTVCNNQICITDQACNARKRVRSAGMIKRVYNPTKNNASYCTNTAQYLISRNLSYSTNEYAYLRQGNPSLTPGPGAAATNIYSAGGISYCDSVIINKGINDSFKYVWINGTTQTITIPPGSYNFNSFVSAFNGQLYQNNTYLINIANKQIAQLLTIAYDNINNLILLQSTNANVSDYSAYTDKLTNTALSSYNFSQNMPYFIIPQTGIQQVIGFTAGNYNQLPTDTNIRNKQSASNTNHLLNPNYARVNYKPSNSKFAQQGAVSSSAAILRKKYNALTTTANNMIKYIGTSTANAMAYGVSENPYTVKVQLGYPDTKYPYVSNGKVVCISDKSNCHK